MVLKMHKHLLAAALSAALSAQAIGSGIPVFDAVAAASLAQQVQHQLQQLAHMVEQINHLQAQYNQLVTLYESIKGGRFLGEILDNPALRESLPAEYQSIYDAITAGGNVAQAAQEIMEDAGQILENEQFDGTLEDFERFVANRQRQLGALQSATAQHGQQAVELRHDQIQALQRQINNTVDLKAAADMQSRMAAELAKIQNETNRLILIRMMQEGEAELAKRQQVELDRRAFYGDGSPQPSILDNWNTWRNGQ